MSEDTMKTAFEMDIPPYLMGRHRAMALGVGGASRTRNPVRVNVNGRVFVLSRSTCIRIPILQRLLTQKKILEKRRKTISTQSSDNTEKVQDELFFERNPIVFAAIIDYVQNSELHAPPQVCPKLFARDLSFWGFNIDEVESCCFSRVVHFLWEQVKLKTFHGFLQQKNIESAENSSASDVQKSPEKAPGRPSIRAKVWKILDEPFTSRAAKVYFYTMCVFILVSFACIATESLFKYPDGDGDPNGKNERAAKLVSYVEWACSAYLYADYLLRFICCPSIKTFFKDLINITDGLAVLTSVAKIVTEREASIQKSHERLLDIIDMLQLLRILRLFRPMSKLTGFRLMYFTLRCSFRELLLVIMLLMFLTIVFSSLLYHLGNDKSIESIFDAMWFSVTTMTTVGYGDIVPTTAETRVIGSVVAVFGVIMMSMTMPIMVSNFNSLYVNSMVGQPSAGKCAGLRNASTLSSELAQGVDMSVRDAMMAADGDWADSEPEDVKKEGCCRSRCCRRNKQQEQPVLDPLLLQSPPAFRESRIPELYSSAEDSEDNAEADVESDAEDIEDFLQKMAARNRNYIRTRDRLFTFSGHSLAFASER